MADAIRLRVGAIFERGNSGPIVGALGRAYGAVAARRLAPPLSSHAAIVGVGGATLGGSGKTPLAIACARVLTERGARVAFVGHAYRAWPGVARRVTPTDPLWLVGDDALLAARALADVGVPVFVAETRRAALALAGAHADVCVVDGLLQASPRIALSLLAVRGGAPWGAGACPPAGDLRAPVRALVAHADLVVPVRFGPARLVRDGRVVDPSRAGRVGLFTACARPELAGAALAALGVSPAVVVRAPDHGPPPRTLPAVDLWVAAPKCALHLASVGVPAAVLAGDTLLPEALVGALAAVAHSRSHLSTPTACAAP